jgi:hypothetical protein
VELTEEEKSVNFLKKNVPDLTPQAIAASYAKFTTPEEAEGFDNIEYEWAKAGKAKEYLQQWVMNKKLTTRIDNLAPGAAFKEKSTEFAKSAKEWQEKLKAFKAGPKKAAKKPDEVEEDVDIFSVTDINDVGEGVPLYEKFEKDDWTLVQLRFELCALVLSFKQDCNDPDRLGIPKDHVDFYYQKYFKKGVQPKQYGMTNTDEVVALVKDCVQYEDNLLTSQHETLEDLSVFLKLTEEHRRERPRRIDAGDETARLKFTAPVAEKPAPKAEAGGEAKVPSEGKKEGGGKSWGKGGKSWGRRGGNW